MQWKELKARLLEAGSARLTVKPADRFIAMSAAGPGAGGKGAIFFATKQLTGSSCHSTLRGLSRLHTVETALPSSILMASASWVILEPGIHCPDQAFITVTGSCIFRCRYCTVPKLGGRRKSIEEIVEMVESVRDRIHAISITSGVLATIEEEEAYVLAVVKRLTSFDLPIGVSIHPMENTLIASGNSALWK